MPAPIFFEVETDQLIDAISVSDVKWEASKIWNNILAAVPSLPETKMQQFYGDKLSQATYRVRITQRNELISACLVINGQEGEKFFGPRIEQALQRLNAYLAS